MITLTFFPSSQFLPESVSQIVYRIEEWFSTTFQCASAFSSGTKGLILVHTKSVLNQSVIYTMPQTMCTQSAFSLYAGVSVSASSASTSPLIIQYTSGIFATYSRFRGCSAGSAPSSSSAPSCEDVHFHFNVYGFMAWRVGSLFKRAFKHRQSQRPSQFVYHHSIIAFRVPVLFTRRVDARATI